MAGSAMKPHLTTSPRPETSSARGSVRSVARSHNTPAGSWKEPTRFLPLRVFTPVLPPTAASTIASRVVGTCTTRTPRSHVAATKPPRSVVAPPPNVTIASERVKPASPRASQHAAATSIPLARSPSGIGSTVTSYAVPSAASTGLTKPASGLAKTTATRWTPSPSIAGSRSATSLPMTTSYGAAPRPGARCRSCRGRSCRGPRGERAKRVSSWGDHASASAISRATSSALRPSVSTTSVATDS